MISPKKILKSFPHCLWGRDIRYFRKVSYISLILRTEYHFPFVLKVLMEESLRTFIVAQALNA